jgi:hypothetical protein
MAVARKHQIQETPHGEAPPRADLRQVEAGDAFASSHNPIGDQLIRLEDAFSVDAADEVRPYPGRVRMAILIGTPVALWALIAVAAMGVRALLS